MIKNSNLTPLQALQKIKSFCSYQERSHFETKNKLFEFGLNSYDVNNTIATLIEENYLNEERFAFQFAGGKFRVKNWGKTKITYELKQHKVSIYNINKALNQICEEDYFATLNKLCNKYYCSLKGKEVEKKYKTKIYLQQKGFELSLILDCLKQINA